MDKVHFDYPVVLHISETFSYMYDVVVRPSSQLFMASSLFLSGSDQQDTYIADSLLMRTDENRKCVSHETHLVRAVLVTFLY